MAASLPKYIRYILVTLQTHGHAAYLVGGCVRDFMLERRPNDWDICTSALPEEVLSIFPGSVPTGLRHGTVTVRVNSRKAEVTTFRSESVYTDHRHPDLVSFVADLNTDLSRRDFTMNAIALSADGLLSDPFGGVEDIKRRLIRCVGNSAVRFEEDALRMFRALRFSARLGFAIEENTLAAISDKAPLAVSLAAERIREELEKILISPRPEFAVRAASLGLLDSYLSRRPESESLRDPLSRLPVKALPRWACFCLLLTRAGCISSAEAFLRALRSDSRTLRCCADCADIVAAGVPRDAVAFKRLLNRYGVDSVTCAALCSDALDGGSACRQVKAVLKSGECFSLRHLAVSGDDLAAMGLRGKELGDMLNFMLDYVIEYPENNRRELLLSLVRGAEE